MSTNVRNVILLVAVVVAFGASPHLPSADAATFPVTSAADSGPGTLRDAVTAANGTVGADVIEISALLASTTITLTTNADAVYGANALVITDSVTIRALGDGTVLSGGNARRIFRVVAGVSLTLEDLTLRDGRHDGFDGGFGGQRGGNGGGSAGMGGAIFNQGVLNADGCTFRNCAVTGGDSTDGFFNGGGAGGGGMQGDGQSSDVSGTFAGTGGLGPVAAPGGVAPGGAGTAGAGWGGGGGGAPGDAITIPGGAGGAGAFGGGGGGGGPWSSVGLGGGAGGAGGAGGFGGGGGGSGGGTPVGAAGPGGFGGGAGSAAVDANLGGAGGGGAGLGGAIFNDQGTTILVNCTLGFNSAVGGAGGTVYAAAQDGAGLGGAIFSRDGSLTMTNCTCSDNSAPESGPAVGGADIYVYNTSTGSAAVTLDNTILANPVGTPRSFQSSSSGIVSGGANNIIEGLAFFYGGGIFSTADPVLGGLTDNGGPTETYALGTTSPAVDNANLAAPADDQRGVTRDNLPDIGAYEFPVTITCPADVTIECDEDSSPANTGAATAFPPGAAAVITFSDSTAAGSCPQASTITRTWTATSVTGDTDQCTQTITVEDTTPPVITLIGPSALTLECGIDTYVEQGATATDNCDPSLPPVTIGGDTVDTTALGVYLVDYDVADACGNDATTVTRTVTVVDTTPPVVVSSIPRTVLWPARNGMLPVGYTFSAVDACDPSPTNTLSVYSNESNTAGFAIFSPDAALPFGTFLQLRAERLFPGGVGRFYIVVTNSVDVSGNRGHHCRTSLCPLYPLTSHLVALQTAAAAAEAACQASLVDVPPAGAPSAIVSGLPLP